MARVGLGVLTVQVIIKKNHKDEILNQITHNTEHKAKERQVAIEEGRKLRAADSLKKVRV
jgi:hypothetical protein